ncbi:hypothetical protein DACRYDRAFT_21740 [Dacryopinax primogenitus]|uniref:Uncharacterized protein n=1 Tax=Dacryopinax primogenitus (strain DJM 731) TaxID=1858805 RepID=M5GA24_DACPD|nr:uncharacterized protein DACRYDRAFT_21740 [Dacryopinax primogenitus]EJU02777.1 hypothetical protein DACRYDRAFT_21740 [Dacryopinax primogenitus]
MRGNANHDVKSEGHARWVTCITKVARLFGLAAISWSSPPTPLVLDVPPKPDAFYGREELVASIIELLLQEKPCRVPLLGVGESARHPSHLLPSMMRTPSNDMEKAYASSVVKALYLKKVL